MKKIKNNPNIAGKKLKITFPKCFPLKRKSIKGGQIPPLPLFCARRPCLLWFASQNASLSTHGTTTPKNLVSQIAFGKRFATLWFVFAKLNFSDENFKTRPHLNILPSAIYLFLLCKNRKRFFWGGRAVSGAFTDDGRNTPRPPLKRGRLNPPPTPSRREGKRQRRIEKNL
ncbi:MAG: hypothetical protein M1273_08285 [Deltaproteobacteria bacterium]|jgi:hypothetical protein|nr:hypothetical protein [Deltaproteobacteria bacterium]